jgi:eukaryotic-like serine/threonine-protein kinase
MSNTQSKIEELVLAASSIASPDERAAFLSERCGQDHQLREQVEQLVQSRHKGRSYSNDATNSANATNSADVTVSPDAPIYPDANAPISPDADAPDATNSPDVTIASAMSDPDVEQTVLTETGPGERQKKATDLGATVVASATDDDADLELMPSLELPGRDIASRYHIGREIAAGGMGVVLRGYDKDLGRDLAIKVLLERHQDNPDMVHRFIEEAQIAGQLQHPGIAPVYEMGKLPDCRPFFSMKLVDGDTLAARLGKRETASTDRSRFISIFEHICQTMAYAHSRGVIHRDLKPANIMVGAFGEVQVMDWGVAKVLVDSVIQRAPRPEVNENNDEGQSGEHSPSNEGGERSDDENPNEDQLTKEQQEKLSSQRLVQTRRSLIIGAAASKTLTGSVMGTPAYMPPEQAHGEIDQLDRRADVFGLGAILCVILTGRPPYVGANGTTIFRLAKRANLDDCHARLDSCGADPELVELARTCLAPAPSDRPDDAGVLAKHVTDYLESVESKLRETEVERAAQEARAEEERKRHRVTLALATLILLMLAIGGGSWNWVQQQAAKRRNVAATKINDALGQTKLHLALADGVDLKDNGGLELQVEELEEAVRQAELATQLTRDEKVGDELRTKAKVWLAGLKKKADDARARAFQASIDRAFATELDLIRLSQADRVSDVDPKDEVFDIYDLFAVESAAPRYEKAFHTAGLDLSTMDSVESADLIRRSPIRESIIAGIDNWIRSLPIPVADGEAASGQPDVAATNDATENNPVTGTGISRTKLLKVVALADISDWRKQLRAALDTGDTERLKELASSADVQQQLPELIAWLGAALRDAREYDTSIVVLRQAHQRHLGDFWLNFELGKTLIAKGQMLEGLGHTRAAVAKRPKSSGALLGLANALWTTGRYEQASAVYKVAVDLSPSDPLLHQILAYALGKQGLLEEAIAEYRQVIQLDDTLADAHNNLGSVLKQHGELDEAIAEYRQAIALDDNYSMAHSNLGVALVEKEGLLEEAIAEFGRAIELDNTNFDAHYNLGAVFAKQEKLVEAIARFRAAVDLRPNDARVQINLDLLMTKALLRGIFVPPAK